MKPCVVQYLMFGFGGDGYAGPSKVRSCRVNSMVSYSTYRKFFTSSKRDYRPVAISKIPRRPHPQSHGITIPVDVVSRSATHTRGHQPPYSLGKRKINQPLILPRGCISSITVLATFVGRRSIGFLERGNGAVAANVQLGVFTFEGGCGQSRHPSECCPSSP